MPRKQWLPLTLILSLFVIGIALTVHFQKDTAQAGVSAPIKLPWTTPPNYRIIYIIPDRAIVKNSIVVPSRLEEVLGANTVTSWNDVLEQNRRDPIEALVIHNSAISQVDKAWLTDAYRQGVVIAVFNVYAPTLAEMLDAPGVSSDGFASEPYPGEFYVIVSRLALGPPEDVAGVQKALNAGAEEPIVSTNAYISTYWGRSTDQLTDEDSLNRFALSLVSHMEGIRQTREEYKNTGEPDTP